MLKINTTWLMIGVLALSAGGLKYLSWRVENLKADLKVVQDESDRQAKEIENIGVSIKNLQTTYKGYQENRAARDTSNAKMNKDSKRGNVVAAKPGLVEKQINASFNKIHTVLLNYHRVLCSVNN